MFMVFTPVVTLRFASTFPHGEAANGVENRNNGTGKPEGFPLAANELATKNRALVARFMRRC
jgi:hypothetical protein